ncbi:MAG: hemerythrin domain-containing protein [Candidatus Marinimicrobia bacterium]|nr:hemerythrin domain-containing protein [Candidatus Neomarinimicrobiota bacterium]
MKPTDILIKEHDAILVMLNILEKVCLRLDTGESVKETDLENIVEFFKVFADKCHHGKEEDILFPALEEYGIPNEGGPIGVMLSEHVIGRDNVKGMNEAIADYKEGKESASKEFVRYARNYIALLTEHIDKENNILFKMADIHIPEERQQSLLVDFERAEEEKIGPGVHEKFHRLLEELSGVYLENPTEAVVAAD